MVFSLLPYQLGRNLYFDKYKKKTRNDRQVESIQALKAACETSLNVQKYPSTISLEALSCFFPYGVAHVDADDLICHQ